MRYQTCERGSGILQRQWAIAALTAAGALAFVLVPTWARDRYVAPSAEPAKVFGSRRAEKTLPALPVTTPHYFHHVYRSILMAPLPRSTFDEGHFPAELREFEIDRTPDGYLGTYLSAGPVVVADNAFFQSHGTNGRSCGTCHQPSSGMSVSVRNIRARFEATEGRDPIFAPVDGANCPSLVPASDTSAALYGGRLGRGNDFRQAYSLLLNKGSVQDSAASASGRRVHFGGGARSDHLQP